MPFRILLVEDDLDDCVFFKDALNETGLEHDLQIATKCTNILERIGTASEKFPHFIFLDLNMPLVSGHECLAMIRKSSDLNQIPVIIYSTSAIKSEADQTFAGGANLYLQKPSSFQLLVIALKRILQMDQKNLISEHDRDQFIYKHFPYQASAA